MQHHLCSGAQQQHHGWVCSMPQVSTDRLCIFLLTYREAEGPILIKYLWVFISSAESKKKKFSLKHCDTITETDEASQKEPLPSHLQQVKAFQFHMKLLAYC